MIQVVILFVEINQSERSDCLRDEVINSPLLGRAQATGSALKTPMHELCMPCSFFSPPNRMTGFVKSPRIVSCIK